MIIEKITKLLTNIENFNKEKVGTLTMILPKNIIQYLIRKIGKYFRTKYENVTT